MFHIPLPGGSLHRVGKVGPVARASGALAAARPLAWLFLKLTIFIVTLLIAWFWNAKTAGADAPGSPAGRAGPAREDRQSYPELAWLAVEEWQARPPPEEGRGSPDAELMRLRLYDIVIAAAAVSGTVEDPRRRMEAISREIFERRGFQVLAPGEKGYEAQHLLLDQVLEKRRGSPLALATLHAAVGELLSPSLELEVVALPGAAAARFHDGGTALSALVAPGEKGSIVRDDVLRARAEAIRPAFAAPDRPRPLKRAELLGVFQAELARAARGRGETEAARIFLARAVERLPDRVGLRIELAELAEAAGDADAALETLEEALVVDPRSSAALARRGALLRSGGDLDGAARDLRRSLELDSRGQEALLVALGDVERERGHAREALEAYRRYLSSGPPPALRDQVLRRVQDLELVPVLEVLRGDAGYPAKFEALRRLGRARCPASTGALVGALRDENLRFARLAWRLLRETTGQEIAFDAAAWERWWSEEGAGLARASS